MVNANVLNSNITSECVVEKNKTGLNPNHYSPILIIKKKSWKTYTLIIPTQKIQIAQTSSSLEGLKIVLSEREYRFKFFVVRTKLKPVLCLKNRKFFVGGDAQVDLIA